MANANGLKKYNAELARVRKAHPNMSQAGLRAKAKAAYNRHKGKKRVKKTVKKKARKRVSGVSTNSRKHTDYNRNRVSIHGSKNITVGSIAKDVKAAKTKILHLIGKKAQELFKATRKPVKRKITKKITALKQQYNRLH